MKSFLATFLCLLFCACTYAGDFITPSRRSGFKRQEIPNLWLPPSIPAKGNEMAVFLSLDDSEEFRTNGNLVSHMIALCGLPSTYMVAKSKKANPWNYLVYDLPSGETVVLYVSGPSVKYFGAAAAFDSMGKLLRMIK